MRPMFHISRRDLGATVTLTPRIPVNAAMRECQKTPRVCFAPSVTQCVIALVGWAVSEEISVLGAFFELANTNYAPTVYHTTEQLYIPDHTTDYHITEEHWALDPVTVERVGYIDCMKMLDEKQVVVTSQPKVVTLSEQEYAGRLSQDDRHVLIQALGEAF